MTHAQRFNRIAHADLPEASERPSKSQRKREMHALQALGETLAELPKDALARIDLPEDLADAVREARRITDHEGRRRQMQYVGRVMRALDEHDVDAIRRAIDTIQGVNKAETARLHALERWRERLLAGDDALTELMARYPHADAQQLRTLIRNARREAAQQKPPKAFRELFQVLRGLFDDAAAPPVDTPDSDLDPAPDTTA